MFVVFCLFKTILHNKITKPKQFIGMHVLVKCNKYKILHFVIVIRAY